MVLVIANHRQLRISYHRACLRRDLLFRPVMSKSMNDPRSWSYWRWRVVEGGRTSDEQESSRSEDASRRKAALEALGYYARLELTVRAPGAGSFPFPDWVQKLAARQITDFYKKGTDWPEITYLPDGSNTLGVRLVGPRALLEEWRRGALDHESHE